MMIIEALVRLHDGPGRRERGDVVSMKAVPHAGWGLDERPPTYAVVKIETDDPDYIAKNHKRHQTLRIVDKEYVRRSAKRLDIDALAVADKAAVEDNRAVLPEARVVLVTKELEDIGAFAVKRI